MRRNFFDRQPAFLHKQQVLAVPQLKSAFRRDKALRIVTRLSNKTREKPRETNTHPWLIVARISPWGERVKRRIDLSKPFGSDYPQRV